MSNVGSDVFLPGLFSTLDLVSRWATAELVFQLCHASYIDLLEQGATVAEIAARDGLDEGLLQALLWSLQVEGIVSRHDGRFKLSALGERYRRYSGYITLFVGGYGPLFRNVDRIVRGQYEGPRRDGKFVGVGSCLISQYDSIPLTRLLMERTRPQARSIIDFGCGNALYLTMFCEGFPELRAIGIEESAEACAEGRRLIAERGLEGRVQLVNSDIMDYEPVEAPDFIIFAFVLHELVAQIGERALVAFLRKLGERFPQTLLLVIEVDNVAASNPSIFGTPMGRGYYNYYFMLHPFTNQRLLPDRQWQELFAEACFKVIDSEVVDPAVDPSGLEIGYVLQAFR